MNTSVDCRELVAAIGDAVVVADTNGLIVLWNAAAERVFGHTEAEALGQSLDLITPERLRQRHWDGFNHSMATGTTRYGAGEMLRVSAMHKDGSTMSIAFTVAMLFDDAGKVSAVISVIRDETKRFNDDRALKKRVAELESKLVPPT
jgi:PAS domain S-box-containing protein